MRHCALNVALYGRAARRWTMTERDGAAVRRGADFLEIGPSAMAWDGAELTVRINEFAFPLPRRVRGTVRLRPLAVESRERELDAAGRHVWQPIAPCARVEVDLQQPGLSWSGEAYFDTNRGVRPLEADFIEWNWSRARLPGGTAVLYDVVRRDGSRLALAMRYGDAGGVEDIEPRPSTLLPRTLWRVPRRIGTDPGATAAVVTTLEDAPFYTRSVVTTRLLGHDVTAMHESLSLDRFDTSVVRAMLPFRVPRALGLL